LAAIRTKGRLCLSAWDRGGEVGEVGKVGKVGKVAGRVTRGDELRRARHADAMRPELAGTFDHSRTREATRLANAAHRTLVC
jgi:hypothetical protein